MKVTLSLRVQTSDDMGDDEPYETDTTVTTTREDLAHAIVIALEGAQVPRVMQVLADCVSTLIEWHGDHALDDSLKSEREFVDAANAVLNEWNEHDEQLRERISHGSNRTEGISSPGDQTTV